MWRGDILLSNLVYSILSMNVLWEREDLLLYGIYLKLRK